MSNGANTGLYDIGLMIDDSMSRPVPAISKSDFVWRDAQGTPFIEVTRGGGDSGTWSELALNPDYRPAGYYFTPEALSRLGPEWTNRDVDTVSWDVGAGGHDTTIPFSQFFDFTTGYVPLNTGATINPYTGQQEYGAWSQVDNKEVFTPWAPSTREAVEKAFNEFFARPTLQATVKTDKKGGTNVVWERQGDTFVPKGISNEFYWNTNDNSNLNAALAMGALVAGGLGYSYLNPEFAPAATGAAGAGSGAASGAYLPGELGSGLYGGIGGGEIATGELGSGLYGGLSDVALTGPTAATIGPGAGIVGLGDLAVATGGISAPVVGGTAPVAESLPVSVPGPAPEMTPLPPPTISPGGQVSFPPVIGPGSVTPPNVGGGQTPGGGQNPGGANNLLGLSSLLSALYGAYSKNQYADQMKQIADQLQQQADPYMQKLQQSYQDPNAYLQTPEMQAILGLEANKLTGIDASQGRLSNDLARTAKLQQLAQSRLGDYRTGLQQAINAVYQPSAITEMYGRAAGAQSTQYGDIAKWLGAGGSPGQTISDIGNVISGVGNIGGTLIDWGGDIWDTVSGWFGD